MNLVIHDKKNIPVCTSYTHLKLEPRDLISNTHFTNPLEIVNDIHCLSKR